MTPRTDLDPIEQTIDSLRRRFLATASHELKSPLTVIRGFAQLLRRRDELSTEEYDDAISTIERRAAELEGVVDRMLLASRIDSESIRLDLDLAPTGAIIERRVQRLLTTTGRDVQLSGGTDPAAWIDAAALGTAVEQLMANAVKFSPSGSPIEVRRQVDGDHLVIAVTDHGIGMESVDLHNCFDQFWQADSSDARRFGGSGLGLYVARSLVEAMAGSLDVDSEVGRGSTFTIRLLLAPPAGLDGTGA